MKFHLVSLGCAKNTADSEGLIHDFARNGGIWVPEPAAADLLLVNTCGFIRDAKEESLRTILELLRFRKSRSEQQFVVFGCLVKRYHEELEKEIPEVDRFLEFISPQDVLDLLRSPPGRPRPCSIADQPSHRLTPPHVGILKVAEGCDNRCRYCAIPDIRGPFHSRTDREIGMDLERLLRSGAREICVVAQDTTRFGEDRAGGRCLLPDLCRTIADHPEVAWIRLHYLHPARLSTDLLDEVFSVPKVLPYFDIPFQHASDRILEAMGRNVTRRHLTRLLGHIRRRWRRAVLRSTFIVGFPGETDDDVATLLGFLEQHPLDRVGAFAYSPEDGTPAAGLKPQISTACKTRRLDELMTLQQVLAEERNQRRWVGRRQLMLIDEIRGKTAIGRLYGDAWPVDNSTHIRYDGSFKVGDFVPIRITGADAYDFQAERAS